MSKPMLFSPGPVMVEECVREAQCHYDICHRSKEFEVLFANIQKNILRLFRADESYFPVVVSGSGTSSNETVLSSVFKSKDEAVLLISNGEFGERLEQIIDKYEIKKIKPNFEWNEYPQLDVIEKALKENEDVKVIACVYHETSTGMINPIGQIGALAKKYNKIFFVDAVSAAAGEGIDVVKQNIDIVTSVAGKCLGGFPGSAYICAKETVFADIKEEDCKNIYLNLAKHYTMAKKCCQTPNTPNVTDFFALDKALERLLDVEGFENRLARYKSNATFLREEFRKMGLKLLIEDEAKMSNTVTSIFIPEGKDVNKFVSDMEESGYVVYSGKGKYLEQGLFQVANMGTITKDDCVKFIEVMKENLNK